MIDSIFVEREVLDHPVAEKIFKRLKYADIFEIERYQEMFNRRKQNFRIQKQNPALILAKKHDNFVLPAPSGFGIDAQKNYYFSHMYNCIYDCRYCFLQGMYSSANYVLFVNYEDFFEAISDTICENTNRSMTFFSGYDCDSLAYNNHTQFIEEAIKAFKFLNNAELEVRTKSSLIKPFLFGRVQNIIIAYSFTPSRFSQRYEIGVPNIEKRLASIKKLVKLGWNIGIRFDPVVVYENWQLDYHKLFKKIFSVIPEKQIHSVTYGKMRFPKYIFKRIEKNNRTEPLFFNLKRHNNLYEQDSTNQIEQFCETNLRKYIGREKLFSNL